MEIEDYTNFYHVDISTQIDNKWRNDSVLAIVKDSEKYSIKIKGKDKEILKERFIITGNTMQERRHNKKVVAIIYSYLLYKALLDNNKANPLLLCRDVRPEAMILNYLRKIGKWFNDTSTINRIIKFRKRIEFESNKKLPKSLAGKYVRKVYRGKISATKILDKNEISELIEIISKII